MKEYKPIKNADVLKLNNIDFTPKVTVIIPCYNVEQYIEECLQSIMSQTLNNMEIICVDDGSSDKTQSILLKQAEVDNRITVLGQCNSGQGSARNQGVLYAQGDYLYFMDGDDLLEVNALQKLYEKASCENLDVLCFDGVSFFDTEQLETQNASYVGYYIRKHDYSVMRSGVEMMCEMRKNKEYRHSPCLQMVKNTYFHEKNLWFLPGVFHEDNYFTFKTMALASRVGHMGIPFFHRRIREKSVMTSKESFKHCYGYFINYLNMLRSGWELKIEVPQAEEISKIVHNAIRNARKTYRKLEPAEQEKYKELSPLERDLFSQLVIRKKKDVKQEVKKQSSNGVKKKYHTIFGKNR